MLGVSGGLNAYLDLDLEIFLELQNDPQYDK